MALVSPSGFDDTVDESAYQAMNADAGIGYSFGTSLSSMRPTAGGTGDRAVSVAAGPATAKGHRIVNDGPITKNHDPVASGSRWDMGVIRRNYSDNEVTFEIIKGSSTRALPSRSEGYPVDDQPVYLARFQAGSTNAEDVVDLRVWSNLGGAVAIDTLALSYLTALGAHVTIDGVQWRRVVVGGVEQWVNDATPARYWSAKVGTPERSWGPDAWGNMHGVAVQDAPAGDYMLSAYAVVRRQGSTTGASAVVKRIQVNGVTRAEEVQDDISGNVWVDRSHRIPYRHAGGAMNVVYQIHAGQIAMTTKLVRVTAEYLGPTS